MRRKTLVLLGGLTVLSPILLQPVALSLAVVISLSPLSVVLIVVIALLNQAVFDRLIQLLDGHAVELGQIRGEDDALAADDKDLLFDLADGKRGANLGGVQEQPQRAGCDVVGCGRAEDAKATPIAAGQQIGMTRGGTPEIDFGLINYGHKLSFANPARYSTDDNTQYCDSPLAYFAELHTLPGSRTEDDIPPEALAKLKSRQHPDHD